MEVISRHVHLHELAQGQAGLGHALHALGALGVHEVAQRVHAEPPEGQRVGPHGGPELLPALPLGRLHVDLRLHHQRRPLPALLLDPRLETLLPPRHHLGLGLALVPQPGLDLVGDGGLLAHLSRRRRGLLGGLPAGGLLGLGPLPLLLEHVPEGLSGVSESGLG